MATPLRRGDDPQPIALVAGLADPTGTNWRRSIAAFDAALQKWGTRNPFFEGPHSDLLALVPFVILCVVLYLVGREMIMTGKMGAAGRRK